ncbi:MAG: hypothetical protein AAF409_20605 [Pseudomonadota bacterium]
MSKTEKKVEVRFGAFSCSIEGYDDPVDQLRDILGMMQKMIAETPALADASHEVDAEPDLDALETAAADPAAVGGVAMPTEVSASGRPDVSAAEDITDEIAAGDSASSVDRPSGSAPFFVAAEPDLDALVETLPPRDDTPAEPATAATESEPVPEMAAAAPRRPFNIFAPPPDRAVVNGATPTTPPSQTNIFTAPAVIAMPDPAPEEVPGPTATLVPDATPLDPVPEEPAASAPAAPVREAQEPALPDIDSAYSAVDQDGPEQPESPTTPDPETPPPTTGSLQSALEPAHDPAETAAPGDTDPPPASDLPNTPMLDAPSASELAKRAGDSTIAGQLAASAAWLTLVKGQESFARRDVMEVLETIPSTDPRELADRIRGFGRLVRAGRLVLVSDGFFAMTQPDREDFQRLIDQR